MNQEVDGNLVGRHRGEDTTDCTLKGIVEGDKAGRDETTTELQEEV
jgi:hypothetical protein